MDGVEFSLDVFPPGIKLTSMLPRPQIDGWVENRVEAGPGGFGRRRSVRLDAGTIRDVVEVEHRRRIRGVRGIVMGRARTCWLVFTVHSAGILTSTRAPSALRDSLSSSPSL
jgi:hypothetical protein